MDLWNFLKHKVVKPVLSALGGLIKYQENDPSTPNLIVMKDIPPLPNPCPPFAVLNFNNADGPDGSVEHQAANIFCTMTCSLTYVQTKLEKQIIRWPALTKLIANPRSGKMFNAYYDRYYLNFFYDVDPKTQQTIYTCESTDVVAHELGHAILDCLRPDLWAVQCVEIQAFHEAFGDINAMVTAMTFPEMVKMALQETASDLSKSNVISKLAEQMGQAIDHARGMPDEVAPALRNAVNTFQYAIPETLPIRVLDDGLAGEPHSFSRVFVGGWYDSFVKIFNAEKANGKSPEDAVASARDKMTTITYNGVRFAQVNARFFSSVLRSMLLYDAQRGLGCGDAIRAGFTQHNLVVPAQLNMTMTEQVHSSGSSLHAEVLNLLSNSNTETVRLSDFFTDEGTPLHDHIIELANRRQFGVFIAEEVDQLHEAIHAAHHSLRVLHEHGRVGEGPTVGKVHDKEFTVIDGRLYRNYYCCGFCRR